MAEFQNGEEVQKCAFMMKFKLYRKYTNRINTRLHTHTHTHTHTCPHDVAGMAVELGAAVNG